MSEAEKGSKRARALARIMVIIIVLAVNVVCIMAIFSLVESGTATPDIYMVGFRYTNNRDGTTYVSARGTVVNPSSLTANNVTVVIEVYVKYMTPPLNISVVDLGRIPGNSSKSFNADVLYSGSYYSLFDGVDYGLLLSSRSDFGVDFFAIALPMAVLLPTLDIYSAYKLGFFGWIRAREKVVAATVAWSVAIAFVIIKSYWLFYNGRGGAAFSNVGGQFPQLYTCDWVSIFILSVVAGAIIANLETIVYSFIASLVLSLIFEVIYGSFFMWFTLRFSESFSIIIPGLSFMTFLESVIGGVFFTILRMINIIVPVFCLLGVFIGAFIRGYLEPSVES